MTDVSLKDHFDALLRALEKYVDTKFESTQVAVELARGALDTRLESMNEIRETMRDQSATMATKEEMTLRLDMIDGRLASLEMTGAKAEGSAKAAGKVWGLVFGFVGGAATVITAIVLRFI